MHARMAADYQAPLNLGISWHTRVCKHDADDSNGVQGNSLGCADRSLMSYGVGQVAGLGPPTNFSSNEPASE